MILKDLKKIDHIIAYKHIKKIFAPDDLKITTKQYSNLFSYGISLFFYKELKDILK
jgi:hypothetical protein